ncbi:Os01g0260700 [Oryza sativa Japonica Group]|uniref:Os01g0260700 protein n=1 Tax=Oryza sativa subsp. japonica TaxID=39947 RepID=Q0JNW9_ORYSJ|nr:Os01g0260700 [Oryza sativa Japonica Group]|eukprot:NP_001042645.2 Os01g0260700 [Oryza sativa Japonica Group]
MDGGGGGGGGGGVMAGPGVAGGGGGGGGGGVGGDVELVSKTLQFEHKLFYFDYYIRTDERDAFSKELRLDTKVFYFDIGENKRGRFLKVSEASVNRNRSTIIVPAGSSGEEGWEAFRNVLLEINNEASRLYVLPNHPNQVQETIPFFDIFMKSQMTSSLNSCHCIWQQHLEPPERLPGLSDDVGAGFIAGHGSQSASGPEVDVERLVDLPPQEEISGMGMSKVIRADQKRFFFDLGSNNRGHYLRISEVAGADRSSIILPLSGLKQFHEMVGHFVDIMKDRLEGMTGANVRTVESSQR